MFKNEKSIMSGSRGLLGQEVCREAGAHLTQSLDWLRQCMSIKEALSHLPPPLVLLEPSRPQPQLQGVSDGNQLESKALQVQQADDKPQLLASVTPPKCALPTASPQARPANKENASTIATDPQAPPGPIRSKDGCRILQRAPLPIAPLATQAMQPVNASSQAPSYAGIYGKWGKTPEVILSADRTLPLSTGAPAAKRQRLAALPEPDAADEARWHWLVQKRDSAGRTPVESGYDGTTLFVPPPALAGMSPFNRQFWSLKSKAMDVVLFVRHGSFYNLFDVDADVGMRAGLQLSGPPRANMWKCGCNADAFPTWCRKVLALGYSVARVEEVTPGSSSAAGSKPACTTSILQRRLVKIYTPSTPPPCADITQDDSWVPRPAVAVVEVVSSSGEAMIGAAVLDAQLRTLKLGQWMDTPSRSNLRTLLLQVNPGEVIAAHQSLSSATTGLLKLHAKLASMSGAAGKPTILPAGLFTITPALQPSCHLASIQEIAAQAEAAASYIHKTLASSSQMCQPSEVGTEFGGLMLLVDRHLKHNMPLATGAVAVLVGHLHRGRALELLGQTMPEPLSVGVTTQEGVRQMHMVLDASAVDTLELVEGSMGGVTGSLLSYLDRCGSRMGSRRIRDWILRPLTYASQIEERLAVVDLFIQLPVARQAVLSCMASLPDCERLLPAAACALDTIASDSCEEGDAGGAAWAVRGKRQVLRPLPHLVLGLSQGVELVAVLKQELARAGVAGGAVLQQLVQTATLATRGLTSITSIIDIDAFMATEEDGSCADIPLVHGMNASYDAACQQLTAAREQQARVVAGVVDHVRHLGASEASLRKVTVAPGPALRCPPDLEPRMVKAGFSVSTRARAVVYLTSPHLGQAGGAVAAAQDQHDQQVASAMTATVNALKDCYGQLKAFVDSLGTLDALAALAEATSPGNAPQGCTFSRPVFTAAAPSVGRVYVEAGGGSGEALDFTGLWHPLLVNTGAGKEVSVRPNSLCLGCAPGAPGALLLTGPNMGGKSTLLRATCVATIMAHMGCYVPAERAVLAPVDRIFTRMGAHDRIMTGESTFMVEMQEAAAVLHSASRASLVVLDELGRGTSTHDGHALAHSTLHHLVRCVGARTLFATHYQGLTQEPSLLPYLRLAHMAHTADPGGQFVALHALQPGPAPQGSAGLDVAQLAGLPQQVVSQARAAADKLAGLMQQRRQRAQQQQVQGPQDHRGYQPDMGGHDAQAVQNQLGQVVRWIRSQAAVAGARY